MNNDNEIGIFFEITNNAHKSKRAEKFERKNKDKKDFFESF
tara:strand:- start:331 stop:453 length:123 start_codon:yes stop_codon:yes gene_type:complete